MPVARGSTSRRQATRQRFLLARGCLGLVATFPTVNMLALRIRRSLDEKVRAFRRMRR